ncbi:COR domain-containing protein [Candidatus Venteria ishoeyi]|uniref:non-specific serine/threonine protein kinase n=1 Tax=Candidatus Venteria ishoeyi TaxID=1899563 RepID=A0A1H6F975_9GAMM|nr:COR domain-containing protein [Candidatus Venteria ishoeyi]SEH05859.1 Miro-like protein [Candidatus Venteria ishoeyi]
MLQDCLLENEGSLIFLGFGGAGKTSVLRTITEGAVTKGVEEATSGIEIREWTFPNSDTRAQFWDFDGQVITHATHQFFLRSRCLYVLVLDGRSDPNANEQAEYWLEHVRAFGGDAPVLLVGNKADLMRINLDMHVLRNKYSNIVDFYPVSCVSYKDKYRIQFERFKRDFIAQLQVAGTHQIQLPKSHFAVLETVRKHSAKQAFLPKNTFEALCLQQGIPEQEHSGLLKVLDNLGFIIHFSNMPWLDSYLINPHWLIHAIYALLHSEQAHRQQGRLDAQTIIDILNPRVLHSNLGHELRYTPKHVRFILEAMVQFEIAFLLNDKAHSVLIPELLPSDIKLVSDFDEYDAAIIDFDFNSFLPRHVLSNFIVHHHKEIFDNIVWRNGVWLRSLNLHAEALIQTDYSQRRLSIWVRGSDAGQYFSVLHEDILHILARMPDLAFEEYLFLSEKARIQTSQKPLSDKSKARASYRDLLAIQAAGDDHFVCQFGTYDLNELLKIVSTDKPYELQSVNPYVAGEGLGNDRTFVGRGELLRKLQALWKKSNSVKPVTLLIGLNRIGTTSLINKIQRDGLEDCKLWPVKIDLQGCSSAYDFWRDVTRGMVKYLKTSAPKLSASNPFADFKDFLYKHPPHDNWRFLLMLDEPECLWTHRIFDVDVTTHLRTLMEGVQYPVLVLFSVNHPFKNLVRKYNLTLFNTAHTFAVSYMTESESNEVLERPAREILEYTPQALAEAYRLTHGHPFLLQILGSIIIEQFDYAVLEEKPRSIYVSLHDMQMAAEDLVKRRNIGCQVYWNQASIEVKQIYSILAWGLNEQKHTLDIAEIKKLLHKHRIDMSHNVLFQHLENLVEQGLLENTGGLTYHFSIPLFHRWLAWRWPPEKMLRMA